MVEYERNVLAGVDIAEAELEAIVERIIKDWNTDEMTELLVECELVLAYNKGRIKELDVRGFKGLWHVISGINKKNTHIVRVNIQEIQEISIKIQKILMKRIDLVSDAIASLNHKMDAQTRLTQYAMIKLSQKISKTRSAIDRLTVENAISQWSFVVQNLETKNGEKYIESSNGMKILLVVSDLFQIVHDRRNLVGKPLLETIRECLKLPDQMKTYDFYKDIIDDKNCISLYVKEGYDYRAGNISQYGRLIYKIYEFYSDSLLKEASKAMNVSLKDLCIKVINNYLWQEEDEINTTKLCGLLLDDLVDLYCGYQDALEKQVQRIEGDIQQEEQPVIETDSRNKDKYFKDDYEEKADIDDECESADMYEETDERDVAADCKDYSILRITPRDGMRMFRNGKCTHKEIGSVKKDECIFSNGNEIVEYIKAEKPTLIIAPGAYLKELKENALLDDNMKYISLADYYMYLWFCKNETDRKGKVLEFIEYYRTDYYISVYTVNDLGDRYKKGSPVTIMHDDRTGPHLRNDYDESCKITFNILNCSNILVFSTFIPDKNIRRDRLNRSKASFVDNTWESILEVDNDKLGSIIKDIVDRSGEIDSIITRRLDNKK